MSAHHRANKDGPWLGRPVYTRNPPSADERAYISHAGTCLKLISCMSKQNSGLPGQSAVTRPSESLNHDLQGSVYIVYRRQYPIRRPTTKFKFYCPLTPWKYPLALKFSITPHVNHQRRSPVRKNSNPPSPPGAPPYSAAAHAASFPPPRRHNRRRAQLR